MPRGPLPPKFAGRGPRPFGSFLGSGLAPAAINRYFRTNDGGVDRIDIPAVSPDRIVMLVYPINGNAGLPAGAPAVTNNELQLIDFAFSGTLTQIGDGFEGILANVLMYDNGTLVRNYPINDNSNTVVDTVSGQNGSVVNGNASDWELFNQQADGDWLGQERVLNGSFESPANWLLTDTFQITGGTLNTSSPTTTNARADQGNRLLFEGEYRTVYELNRISGSSQLFLGNGGAGTARSSSGVFAEDIQRGTTDGITVFGLTGFDGSIDNLSIKRLLRVA